MSIKSTLPKGVGRDLSRLHTPARPHDKPNNRRDSDRPHLSGAAKTDPTKTERTGANGR